MTVKEAKMIRKKFSPDFKARVAIDVIRHDATIPELSKRYGAHPTQIKTWEKILKERAVDIFTSNTSNTDDQSEYIAALERKTGQLALENDFLKKNLMKYPKGTGL